MTHYVADDGNQQVLYDVDTPLEAAEEYASAYDADEDRGTYWVHIYVRPVLARATDEDGEEIHAEACDGVHVHADCSGYAPVTPMGGGYCGHFLAGRCLGEYESHRITIEPDEPACNDDEGHDWQSPYEIVGGIKENPGVWGHGGGVKIHEACMRCGCGRVTNTWAQDPEDGTQGLTSVRYERGRYADEIASK